MCVFANIAASLGITERRAHGIVTDLTEAGYLVKTKDGRRNRYEVQSHLPIPEQPRPASRAIGEVLDLLTGRAVPGRTIRRSGGAERPRRRWRDPHTCRQVGT